MRAFIILAMLWSVFSGGSNFNASAENIQQSCICVEGTTNASRATTTPKKTRSTAITSTNTKYAANTSTMASGKGRRLDQQNATIAIKGTTTTTGDQQNTTTAITGITNASNPLNTTISTTRIITLATRNTTTTTVHITTAIIGTKNRTIARICKCNNTSGNLTSGSTPVTTPTTLTSSMTPSAQDSTAGATTSKLTTTNTKTAGNRSELLILTEVNVTFERTLSSAQRQSTKEIFCTLTRNVCKEIKGIECKVLRASPRQRLRQRRFAFLVD